MSECVVRMEMPEKCDECPAWCICGTLHKYMLGIDCDSDWTYDDLLVITVETGFVKPDNCPIICSLPEGHGRLVDKDEVIESIRTEMTELFFNGLKGTPRPDGDLRFMWNRLEDEDFAPTIVPAEEERSGT